MAEFNKFTIEEAKNIGSSIGIDWSDININEFRIGIEIELEHGDSDPETNVIGHDYTLAGKIAWAHLKEIRDYYSRLTVMEKTAEAYWKSIDSK